MNTTYFLNQIMGNLFHTDKDPELPAAYYLGFSGTEPTDAGTNVTEPSTSDTGYSRVMLTNLSAPTNGVINNTAPISFPKSTESWGVLTHYVVYDAVTGGNLLFYDTIANSITVDANAVITIPTGDLVITLKNAV